ncbi:hypothetical protein DL770_001765 [Monosporascus sp. CRB-9-2]|nr:hypothetical protein DL770_001765 [Monosporascus sp. CRB-9-2]
MGSDGMPLIGSPPYSHKMAETWPKPSSRWRLGMVLPTSPKKLCVVTFCFFFTSLVLVGGSFRARRYIVQKAAEQRAAEEPAYHWQRFPRLNGFYNGVRSLVNYTDWVPEQQAATDAKFSITKLPPVEPVVVDPYPQYDSPDYLKGHHPVKQCFIDEDEKVPAPDIFAYPGIPANMSAPYWGSYDILNMAPDRCFERFGRLGPYGYSYNPSEGGLGLANYTEHAGADEIQDMFEKVDYRNVNWGKAQQRCFEKNRERFEPSSTSTGDGAGPKKRVPRTAYVLRTWTGYEYSDIQLLSLRAMINELSLKSGGEYDVHFLVHVKNDSIPIWASEEVYNETLQESVPSEFWDMSTLWSEEQMRTYYPGPFPDEENLHNHAEADVYGVYRSAHFALQWFAQHHPEYDFFWNWEMDVRYLGHYYEFHNGVSEWAAAQPRKLLWERSARFWIPSLHGTYSAFSEFVANETRDKNQKPIWGPMEFETGERGMLAAPEFNKPPTTFDKDNYEWGVGEEADLLTFNPIFDPTKTNWVFRDDVSGYNVTKPPPRRAALVTIGRLSKRLLQTMHEETSKMRRTMFPEMWPSSVALHHGFKAAYVPHPVYFEHKWPLDTMNQIFNYPTAPHESPFGWGEHNFQGASFYYDSGLSGVLWRRWLGSKENGMGGKRFEEKHSGRMCLRGILHHPIKSEGVESSPIWPL